MNMEKWTVSNIENAKYIGIIEFQDNQEEWHNFEVLLTEDQERLVFGGSCNTGFLESGFVLIDSCFSLDANLQTMLQGLDDYYNEGPDSSTLICNERM